VDMNALLEQSKFLERHLAKLDLQVQRRQQYLVEFKTWFAAPDCEFYEDARVQRALGKIEILKSKVERVRERQKMFEAVLKPPDLFVLPELTVADMVALAAQQQDRDRTKKIFSRPPKRTPSEIYEIVEMQILSKELECYEKPISSEGNFDAAFEKLIEKIGVIGLFVSKQTASIRNLDQSLEKSFQRLADHLAVARESLNQSLMNREEFGRIVAQRDKQSSQLWTDRENADTDDDSLAWANNRKQSSEIETALALIDRNNVAAQDALFYSETIVSRLSSVKMLLEILPRKRREDSLIQLLKKLIDSVSATILKLPSKENAKVEYQYVHEHVSKLEHRVLSIYVRIAKDVKTSQTLKGTGLKRRDLEELTTALNIERVKNVERSDQWQVSQIDAELENNETRADIAGARAEYCAGVTKTIDLGLSVISIILEASEK